MDDSGHLRDDDEGYFDEEDMDAIDDLNLVFRLKDSFFSFPAKIVCDMVPLDRFNSLPDHPDYVRGVIDWRKRVIPLVDTRILLGIPSMANECDGLTALMNQREQDHRNWLRELEDSVRENRAFTLATDPHKCAFGRWYDAFHTSNNAWAMQLARFDAPHRKIHGVAHTVLALAADGRNEEAHLVIERTRNTILRTMIDLFEELRHSLQQNRREIAIILETEQREVAFVVDSGEAVQAFEDEVMAKSDLATKYGNRFVSGMAKFGEDDTLVMRLDTGRILEYCGL